MVKETFGSYIREKREEQRISLRRLAEQTNMSFTYLGKIERDDLQPPAEEKVVALAKILHLDKDELLAKAGRIPGDVLYIIKSKPKALSNLIRAVANRSEADINMWADNLPSCWDCPNRKER